MSRHRKRNSTQPVASARSKRSHRAPPALDAKIFVMGKRKTIQHYKLPTMIEKDLARVERHSSDDSGYEESDIASTVSPNPSLYEGMSPLHNSSEDLSSADQLPTCVSEAGRSDSDSNADSLETSRKPAGKRGRRPYKQAEESKVDYLEMDRSSGEEVHPSKRMLMKDWILYHVIHKSFSGMKWYNQEQNLIQISWKHRSAGAWCREDVKHFESWARYTGRHTSDSEFKRWKANFRCALNILPEIDEVKELKNSKGKNPYKVYRINECQARRRKRKASSSQPKQAKPRKRQLILEEEPQDTDDSSTADETEMAVEQILNRTPTESVPTSRLPSILPPITLTTTAENTPAQQRLYYSQTSQPYNGTDGSFLTISSSPEDLVVPTWAQPESLASRRNISPDCALQGLDLLQSQQLPPMEIFQNPFDENALSYCGLQALTPVDEINIYPEVGLLATSDLITFTSDAYQPLQDILLQSEDPESSMMLTELRPPSILDPVTPESPNAPVLPLFVTQMNEELL